MAPTLLAGGPWWIWQEDGNWTLRLLLNRPEHNRPLQLDGIEINARVSTDTSGHRALVWTDLTATSGKVHWRGHTWQIPKAPTNTATFYVITPGAWPENEQHAAWLSHFKNISNTTTGAHNVGLILLDDWSSIPRFGHLSDMPLIALLSDQAATALDVPTRRTFTVSHPQGTLHLSRDLNTPPAHSTSLALSQRIDWQWSLPDLAVAAHQGWDFLLGAGPLSALSESVQVNGGEAIAAPNETDALAHSCRLLSYRQLTAPMPATWDRRWIRSSRQSILLAWQAEADLHWWLWQAWRALQTEAAVAPATGPEDPWQRLLSARSHDNDDPQASSAATTAPSQPKAAWANWPRESWMRRLPSSTRLRQALQASRQEPALLQRFASVQAAIVIAWLAQQNPTHQDADLIPAVTPGPSALPDLAPVLNRALATDPSLLGDTRTQTALRHHADATTIELLLAHLGGRYQVPASRGLMTITEREDHAQVTQDQDLRLRWYGQLLLSPHLSPDRQLPLALQLLQAQDHDPSWESVREQAARAYERLEGSAYQPPAAEPEQPSS
jgi:hypothetical protein